MTQEKSEKINKEITREKNIAFVDGQNLFLGTKESDWAVDFKKFRIYLKDRYSIETAYYFIGYKTDKEDLLYTKLQNSGFVLIFKDHDENLFGKKKGNVDSDIIFEVMKNLLENKDFNSVLLVSGDGDYIKLTDYLISINKFKKILFPNKKFASSLYRKYTFKYYDYLEIPETRAKIEYKRKNRIAPDVS